MSKIAIRLNAGNDRNGNPRRAYIVLDERGIADVIDEGSQGVGALHERYPRLYPVADFDTTPAEYRKLKKRANETLRLQHGPDFKKRKRSRSRY